MGCFKDANARDLKYGPLKNGYTLSTCEAACTAYKYIALQGSAGLCSCDDTYATPMETHLAVNTVECDEKRAWRNAVWENSQYVAPPEEYLGCYLDRSSRDLLYGPKKHGYDVASCQAACKRFKYIGLQHYQGGKTKSWCSCDSSYHTPSATS